MELTTKDAFRVRVVPFSAGEFTGFVRIMSGKVRNELMWMNFKDDAKQTDLQSEALSRCLCDKSGALLFDSPSEIAEMDGAILSEIFDECWRINGFGDKAKGEAKNS